MRFGRHFGRTARRWLLITAGALLALSALINNWVVNNTHSYITDDWALLPVTDTGLVLGTSPLTRSGEPNPQFKGRIEAAAQLFQAGKIKHIIVSGANPDATYNEPRAMRRELIKAGVPRQAIIMDFAGFRTFDSVARAQAVFGLDHLTIITQRYHAYRAVFIAKKLHMDVAGYAAPGGEPRLFTRTLLREFFARVKAVLDIYVLRTQPKFLGTPQPVEGSGPASESDNP